MLKHLNRDSFLRNPSNTHLTSTPSTQASARHLYPEGPLSLIIPINSVDLSVIGCVTVSLTLVSSGAITDPILLCMFCSFVFADLCSPAD